MPKCPRRECGGDLVPFSGEEGMNALVFMTWRCPVCGFTFDKSSKGFYEDLYNEE